MFVQVENLFLTVNQVGAVAQDVTGGEFKKFHYIVFIVTSSCGSRGCVMDKRTV